MEVDYMENIDKELLEQGYTFLDYFINAKSVSKKGEEFVIRSRIKLESEEAIKQRKKCGDWIFYEYHIFEIQIVKIFEGMEEILFSYQNTFAHYRWDGKENLLDEEDLKESLLNAISFIYGVPFLLIKRVQDAKYTDPLFFFYSLINDNLLIDHIRTYLLSYENKIKGTSDELKLAIKALVDARVVKIERGWEDSRFSLI